MAKYNSALFLAEIAELLQENEQDITPETALFDLESWDSLSVAALLAMVDKKYELILSPQAIGECQTVGDLQALVENPDRQAA